MNMDRAMISGQTILSARAGIKFLPFYAFIFLAVVLAVLGTVLAARSLSADAPAITEIHSINQPAVTSYGSLIVSGADDLIGLTSEDLAGVTHGIQNLVMADSTQIQLTVALINNSSKAVALDPKQFQLVSPPSAEPILITGATIRSGEIRPRSSINITLSFVVPRDGASYILQYDDPGSDQTVQIGLGGVDVVSPEELDAMNH